MNPSLDPHQLQQIVELRRALHAHPELSGQESATRAIIADFLRTHTTLTLTDHGDWLEAFHGEDPALPTLAFRAELDAIPVEGCPGQARHGCGHDGHAAALCGLALALEGAQLGRNVALLFQSAEETGEGGRLTAATWPRASQIQRIYALHNIPGFAKNALIMRRGGFACASCGWMAHIQGRPAHAAYPGDGANPCALISQLVLETPEMIRDILSGDDRLLMHTVVGMRAGGENFGMSAAEGTLCMTLRGHRQQDIDALIHRLQSRAQEGCRAQGMTCTFELRDVFPDTRNDDAAYDHALEVFQRAGLPIHTLEEPMRWSEDFGWLLKKIPGVYFGIGGGEDAPGLHTQGFEFDDSLLPRALEALILLAEH